jgi:hypothetical protein
MKTTIKYTYYPSQQGWYDKDLMDWIIDSLKLVLLDQRGFPDNIEVKDIKSDKFNKNNLACNHTKASYFRYTKLPKWLRNGETAAIERIFSEGFSYEQIQEIDFCLQRCFSILAQNDQDVLIEEYQHRLLNWKKFKDQVEEIA